MKVSIITTYHNAEEFVSDSIASVMNQTHDDVELILFDDGSDDGSHDICSQFAYEFDNIKLLGSFDDRIGRTNALIEACKHATGEFIGLVDADDFIVPDCIEKCLEAFKSDRTAAMVYTHHMEMNQAGDAVRVGMRCNYPYSLETLQSIFNTFHFRLIRKDVFDSVGGYNNKFELAADYDLSLRIAERFKVVEIPEILYFYRRNSSGISRTRASEQRAFAEMAQRESRSRTEAQ